MKQLLTIKTMFNDVFTDYKDKIDTIVMSVDPEKDCECTGYRKCGMCELISQGTLSEFVTINGMFGDKK